MRTPSSDMWAPLTTQKSKGWQEEYLGNFTPAFLLAPGAEAADVRQRSVGDPQKKRVEEGELGEQQERAQHDRRAHATDKTTDAA